MPHQTVLVTGGSGFLGINLIRMLVAQGYRIVSIDLEPFTYADMRDRITAVVGDVRDRAAVDRVMADVDFVVHTAAALPLYAPPDIYTTDVEGTRTVLESALAHGVRRFVHISSTAVYGIPDHHPLVETDRLEGVGPYGQAKIQAEMVCLEYRARGLVVPIIRPKSFIGPERLGVFALLYDWALDGHNFPMIGSGRNRLFVDDGGANAANDPPPGAPDLQGSTLYRDAIAPRLSDATRDALAKAKSPMEWNTFLLSSPDFNYR